MKKVKRTIEYEGYSEACPICGKLIEGISPLQIKCRMEMHQRSKKCKKIIIKNDKRK